MATAALMIAVSAERRHESRGGHYRSDMPDAMPALAQRSTITLDDALAQLGAAPERRAAS